MTFWHRDGFFFLVPNGGSSDSLGPQCCDEGLQIVQYNFSHKMESKKNQYRDGYGEWEMDFLASKLSIIENISMAG